MLTTMVLIALYIKYKARVLRFVRGWYIAWLTTRIFDSEDAAIYFYFWDAEKMAFWKARREEEERRCDEYVKQTLRAIEQSHSTNQ